MKIIFKKLFYLFYPIHTVRNFFQYIVGALLFLIFFGHISLMRFFFGMFSFILAYTFVYGLNDILDYENDKKDKKIQIKKRYCIKSPLMLNVATKEELFCFLSFALILGILLSFFVNLKFSFLIFILVFLNIIHSNPFFNVRKIPLILIPNMFLIQFVKFSIGWFAQTTQFNLFPSWLIVVFSGTYVFAYVVHKYHFNFSEMPLNQKLSLLILAIFSFFAYLISYFLYDIILPLLIASIILLILTISYINFSNRFGFKKKMFIGTFMVYICIIVMITSILLIKLNPFLWKLNEEISQKIIQNSETQEFILLLNQSSYSLIPKNTTFINLTLIDICKDYVLKNE